ncbi:MAG: metallophosphoesterase, partial [Sphaerochaetaceae bacterium]
MKRFSRSISLFFLITMLVLSLVGCATKAPKAEVTEVVQETAPQETQEVKEQAPAAPMAEEKKPEAAPAAPVTVTVKPLEYSFDIYGYKVAIEAYDGYAYVTYPDFVTDAELGAAAQAALAAYPQYLSGVTYQITAPGKVTVNFMKGLTKADAVYAVGLLQSNLKWYIDKMFAAPAATTTVPAETTAPAAEAAAPVAPVAQALKYSFDVYGYKVAIEAYDGYAYVTYPDFVTDAELAAAAKAALAAYPQYLSSVTYQITAPGKVTVNFMKGLTVADAEYAVALLQSNLKWYVDQMFAQPAAPTTTATAVAETKPAETAAPAAEAAPVAEVVEVVEVVEEITYPYGVTPIVKDASGATEFSLYIVHTNDVHARVTEGQDGSMGYAKLATLLKWGRSLTDDILLLDAGDVTHGTNFANLFKGQTILNLLDMLGYDAVAPGNHDFNYGFDVLKLDAQVAAKYSTTRVLCANILDENGVLQFQPYQIYDFNGFR